MTAAVQAIHVDDPIRGPGTFIPDQPGVLQQQQQHPVAVYHPGSGGGFVTTGGTVVMPNPYSHAFDQGRPHYGTPSHYQQTVHHVYHTTDGGGSHHHGGGGSSHHHQPPAPKQKKGGGVHLHYAPVYKGKVNVHTGGTHTHNAPKKSSKTPEHKAAKRARATHHTPPAHAPPQTPASSSTPQKLSAEQERQKAGVFGAFGTPIGCDYDDEEEIGKGRGGGGGARKKKSKKPKRSRSSRKKPHQHKHAHRGGGTHRGGHKGKGGASTSSGSQGETTSGSGGVFDIPQAGYYGGMQQPVMSLIGPAIGVDEQTRATVTTVKQEMLQYGAYNNPRTSAHHALTRIAPEMRLDGTLVPLLLQLILARGDFSKTPTHLSLTFINENEEPMGSARATGVPLTAAVARQTTTRFTLNHPLTISDGQLEFAFSNDLGEEASYTVAISPSSALPSSASASSAVSSGRELAMHVNLYNNALHSFYVEEGIMLPIAVLEITPISATSFALKTVNVAVLFDPEHQDVYAPQLVHYPELASAGGAHHYHRHRAVKAHRYEGGEQSHSAAINQEFSTKLVEALGEPENPRAISSFHFTSSGGTFNDKKDHRVFWGHLTHIAVAFTVLKLVRADQLDDVDFFVNTLRGKNDHNGAGVFAVEVISRLYENYHPGGVQPHQQSFPSLRNLLMHTSGLPTGSFLSMDEVRAHFKTVQELMRNPEGEMREGAEGEQQQQQQMDHEKMFSQKLQTIGQLTSMPGASIGEHAHLVEAGLLSMFLRRFQGTGNDSAEHIVNEALKEHGVVLEWGLYVEGEQFVESESRPEHLANGASSRYTHLVQFVRTLMEMLHSHNPGTPIHQMLANPIHEVGDLSSMAHTIGWHKVLVSGAGNLSVYYAQAATPSVDAVFVALVPELDFWMVFHEDVKDPSSGAKPRTPSFSLPIFLEAVKGAYRAHALPMIPPRSEQDVVHTLPQSRYADTVDKIVPDVEANLLERLPHERNVDVYYEPSQNAFVGKMRQARIGDIDPKSGRFSIVFKLGKNKHRRVFINDPESNTYRLVRNPENPTSPLGEIIFIDKDVIAMPGTIFVHKRIMDPLVKAYHDSLAAFEERMSSTAYPTPAQTALQRHLRHSVSHVRPGELEGVVTVAEQIGGGRGGGGGGGGFHGGGGGGGFRGGGYRGGYGGYRGGYGYGLYPWWLYPTAVAAGAGYPFYGGGYGPPVGVPPYPI